MSKALSRYMNSEPEPGRPSEPRRWVCVAHGCPVTAGISYGTTETICRFHDGEPASVWQKITDGLRKRAWMVRLCDWLYTGDGPHSRPTWFDEAKELCFQHKHDEANPQFGESAARYARRLNSILFAEVMANIERPAPSFERTGPVKVGDALPKRIGK